MAKLTVSRSKEWNNKVRTMKLLVDNAEIGTLANGDTKTFEIAPGMHTFQARISWYSSPEIPFMMAGGENKSISVCGNKLVNVLSWIALGIIIFEFMLKYFYQVKVQFVWGLIPIVAIQTYYALFARGKYLEVKENITPSSDYIPYQNTQNN